MTNVGAIRKINANEITKLRLRMACHVEHHLNQSLKMNNKYSLRMLKWGLQIASFLCVHQQYNNAFMRNTEYVLISLNEATDYTYDRVL